MSQPLSRRRFLQGSQVCLLLPFLESFHSSIARGAAAKPARFFAFYQPAGSYSGSLLTGNPHGFWIPKDKNMANTPLGLMPLQSHMQDLCIVTGLENASGRESEANFPNYKNYPAPTGADLNGGEYILPFGHGRGTTSFLTCGQARRNADRTFKTVEISNDSFDQVLVKNFKSQGTHNGKSFVVSLDQNKGATTDVTSVDYTCNISYVDGKAFFPMRDPSAILDNFFVGATGGDAGTLALQRKLYSKSHLDYMKGEITSLKNKLSKSDQNMFSGYLDSVRQLEIDADSIGTGLNCSAPTNPPSGSMDGKTLTSFYVNYANFAAKAAVLAMRCDRIRVGAMMFGNESTGINYKDVITGADRYLNADMDGGRHLQCAHHNNDTERLKRLVSIHHFESKVFKLMLEELKNTQEADGSGNMLDNTVLMMGGNLSDGNRHDNSNVVRILAGGKNHGMPSNRVITTNASLTGCVFMTIAQKFGINLPSFGSGLGKTSSGLSGV